jgi:hypothetical protein
MMTTLDCPETIKIRRVLAVWVALITATALSWYLGDGHGEAHLATVGVLVVAFFKVYLVGRYFMELGSAPRALHAIFTGWTVVMCSVTVALYLSAV